MQFPRVFLRQHGRWLLLASLVALLSGTASAVFLMALDWATRTREAHPWLLAGLPLMGMAVGWVYWRLGRSVERGNNLLIDEIHDPQQVVPLRMAPLILLSTVLSHLFGASVGREGTAVQMGGALADQLTHLARLRADDRSLLLMTGISAGFASVFGTPLAGAVFALEVLAIGRLKYDALWPCLLSAVLADQVCRAWGIQHEHYLVDSVPAWSAGCLLAVALVGIGAGWVGRGFAASAHALSAFMTRQFSWAPWRPLVGGTVLALLTWGLDAHRYAGLSLAGLSEAFVQPLPGWDWLAKAAFTVGALGTGFKGGEVTPLFYIGATFGNALAPWLHQPLAWMAALGMVAVFAGAANTPLACTLLAVELFGADVAVTAALACVLSYLASGHAGIYKAQRVERRKHRLLP
ncbi:voltage-gated chloride channel family protein [Aquabacterium sp.]|uniref:voltage-gated chloride channel family protein n=1 Tax=Aquabacterium sp. TaxID=1872578 RepID=UPI003B691DF2